MNDKFQEFRPSPTWPVYPPYAKEYFEEYFFRRFTKENPKTQRKFIPVSWSACYINNNDRPLQGLQEALSGLDPDGAYFAVATHDDAVRERLPKNTMVFSAGGNSGDIPIPLVCSSIPNAREKEKDIFCSFMGSMTHPIRTKMVESLSGNSKYLINAKKWSNKVSKEEESAFQDVLSRSKFALCPRGYGPTSYRLYEALQLGAVPVYLYSREWLPFQDDVDWTEFCVLIHESQVQIIDIILSSIDEEEILKKKRKGLEAYRDFFTIEKSYEKILEHLAAEEHMKKVMKL